MKRFTLLLAFCIIGFTASAQFWKRKRQPQPEVVAVQMHSIITIANATVPANAVVGIKLINADYALEVAEEAMIKEAKHNMRFRVYNVASYNFSDLAALYLKQNRFSEAKWYLLQSNTIARKAENSRHLIDNLLILADIKSIIGETALALVDLQEAHDVAISKGMLTDVSIVDKKIKYLQTNKTLSPKAELRYANAVEVANSAKAAPVN